METEKVCVNLPAAELGKLDVLVAAGLFASRTDVIRSGIRLVLTEHEDTVRRVTQDGPRIGYQLLTRSELERAEVAHKKLDLLVIGVLRIENSVTPELASSVIERIRIFGAIRAPQPVLDRLGDRVVRGAGWEG